MEQLNKDLPAAQEEMKSAADMLFGRRQESPLLGTVRQKFGTYGGISLIFGGAFALLFYKTWLGLNVLAFASLVIMLLCFIITKLSLRIKIGTKLCFIGVFLLGMSTCLTASGILQFLNVIGILFLLDLALLHQFYEDKRWGFVKYVGKMFGMIFYSIATISMPIVDGVNFLKRIRLFKNDYVRNIFLGIIVAIPLLLITTALLSNADMIFGEITNEFYDTIFSADIFFIGIMIILGFFACYCILCGVLSQAGLEVKKAMTKADPTIAITFMGALCLMYAFFCGIQLVYLFANGLLTLPAEFTFAEYARSGFFELLAVTIINIVIMLLCNTLFKESKLLRFLVTFMTTCTYIMIASAVYRMLLYIGAYHLTFLRLFVLLTLLIDAFVLAGIIIAQYKKEFPLFWYCIVVISICYIPFSFAKPDYFIASYLADHNEMLTLDDMLYLTEDLSLDAAPSVLPLLKDTDRWATTEEVSDDRYDKSEYRGENHSYQYYINEYYNRIDYARRNTGIRDFNYSYHKAVEYANQYPMINKK